MTHLGSKKIDFESTTETLTRLARLAGDQSTEMEDKVIDDLLFDVCRSELDREDDTAIEAALTELKAEQSQAYDELLAIAEECAQTVVKKNTVSELILIPVLLWSRYKIAAGAIADDVTRCIAQLYKKHFLNDVVKITVGDTLITSQQLPEKLRDVRHLLQTLTETKAPIARIGSLLCGDVSDEFSDTRYIALALTAPSVRDLVSANISYIERAHAQMQFSLDVHKALESTFLGSVFEVQLPTGFFRAWRMTEAAMRVFALKSLVDFVHAMRYGPSELIATSGLFFRATESETEPNVEVRIGIATRTEPQRIIAGLTWPTTEEEAEANQSLIREVLESKHVHRIVTLEQRFTMEWCEECGAPLYANFEGLITHIEVPQEIGAEATPPTLN